MVSDVQYVLINVASESNWTDDIPAIVSVFIAFLALFATVYQSHLARKHNRLSVAPHIEVHSEENDNTFIITIRNDGFGPAILGTFNIYENNNLVAGDGEALIKNAFANLHRCEILATETIRTPFVLPQGHTIQLVTLKFDDAIEPIDDYIESQLRLEIKYQSFYGEEFNFDSASDSA